VSKHNTRLARPRGSRARQALRSGQPGVLYIRTNPENQRVPRKKKPNRRARPAAPVGEWLPLPILLTLAAGMIVFAVFQLAGTGSAALAAVAVALAGGLWWHRYQSAGEPMPQRRPRGRRSRRS